MNSSPLKMKCMILRNLLLVCIIFIANLGLLEAQEDNPRRTKFDFGINITSVISHFVGNESTIEASNFPILLRLKGNRFRPRIGLGGDANSNTFRDPISGNIRENSTYEAYLKLGVEANIFREKKWEAYWGIDLIGGYINDTSINVFDQIELEEVIISIGGGPLIGLIYNLTDRIYLSTESSFYVNFLSNTVKANGITEIKRNDFAGAIEPPLFLFVNYRF